jgi:hypothetical protein
VGRWILGAVAPAARGHTVFDVSEAKVFLSESLERSAPRIEAMDDLPGKFHKSDYLEVFYLHVGMYHEGVSTGEINI